MWDYTESVMDHFTNPRNVGKLENANAVGQVGSLACGDALKLYLRVNNENEVIEDASFQTFGCASAIASASALTELIKKKTITEASKITNNDIVKFLGGLPEQKMHCSVMGKEALEAAISDYRGKKVVSEEHKDEAIICKCFWVDEKRIRDLVKENKLTTVEEVTHYTKAGGGCSNCVDGIQDILNDINGKKDESCGTCNSCHNCCSTGKHPKLTNLQRIKLITSTIDNKIAPILKADGGNIELVDVDGKTVYVRLQGACKGCPGAKATLQNIVKETLRKDVSDDIIIVETD